MIVIDIIRMPNPTMSLRLLSPSRAFVPGPFDVICARGKQAYNHEGNRYFRGIVNSATEKYSAVESKLQRSMIVTDIIDAIRAKGNGFLRKNGKGEWIECTDVMCREKVGQHFRNALGCIYKSSTKSKRHVKEKSIPRFINSLHNIVFSSKLITKITERFAMDIIFIEESSDDAFYEKAFAANMKLLQVFKEDKCLVKRFQNQFCLGQQQELSYRTNQPQNSRDALAAQ